MNEEELEKQAVNEILQEAVKNKQRAAEFGTVAWSRPKSGRVNKRFLSRTLLSAAISRRSGAASDKRPPALGTECTASRQVSMGSISSQRTNRRADSTVSRAAVEMHDDKMNFHSVSDSH